MIRDVLCVAFLIAFGIGATAQAGEWQYRLPDEVSLKPRAFTEPVDNCQNCHLTKHYQKMPDIKLLKRRHENYSTLHGTKQMSCNACHDGNNHNYLRSTRFFPATFHDSSPVCQQCHADKFSSWMDGIHGKRLGEWGSKKVQFNCVDCHKPHSVPFKPMESIATPQKPNSGSKTDVKAEALH